MAGFRQAGDGADSTCSRENESKTDHDCSDPPLLRRSDRCSSGTRARNSSRLLVRCRSGPDGSLWSCARLLRRLARLTMLLLLRGSLWNRR